MTTTEAREYLVKFMEQHFTDKTFHRYIRGQRREVNLAGDFAWQMARALRMIQVSTETGAPSHPAGPAAGGHGE
jgi:plasmid maintenance system killer protein